MAFDWMMLVDALVKMILALVCGGVLGIERGRKKRPAGFRTYMLVCLGATLVMMTNDYICQVYGSGDMARMGAQVVNGIGFLGAGTIITTGHNRVKGLTTAAGLWAAACIGLAIGSGYYIGGVLGTIMIVLIMVVFQSFDQRLLASTRVVILYVEFQTMSTIREMTSYARANQMRVEDVEIESSGQVLNGNIAAVVTMRLYEKKTHVELVEQLSMLEGVKYVEEI